MEALQSGIQCLRFCRFIFQSSLIGGCNFANASAFRRLGFKVEAPALVQPCPGCRVKEPGSA